MNDRFARIADRVWDNLRADDYAGWDPFDGLNSRFFNALIGLRSIPLVRLVWLQLHKRLRWNFRPLFRIPKVRNPKGVALVILALLARYRRTGDAALLDEAVELGDWLLANPCDRKKHGGVCWGYPFPWQARAFFVPLGTPNLITTVYVAKALYALRQAGAGYRFVDAAISAGLYLGEQHYEARGGGAFYRYIPGESVLVHNANLWGAATVCRAATESGRTHYLNGVKAAVATSLEAQAEDGSWRYGERHHHAFVDGFHTGYNLEALSDLQDVWGDERYNSALQAGRAFYKDNLFESDGTAKYYAGARDPLDAHSFAQGSLVWSRFGARDLAQKILGAGCDHLWDEATGQFAYQVSGTTANRVPYMRWTQAWMLYALEAFLAGESSDG
jgi:polysaccharide biosynthesis protein VpsJ